jgi:hypothetical protein
MKAPAFDRNLAQWDAWKEFHIDKAGFTFFESGEVIASNRFHTRSGWGHSKGHSDRGYKQWGVTVFQVNDNPDLLLRSKLRDPVDGTIVKKSWLPQAYPMIYDRDAKRVIALQWIYSKSEAAEMIPSRFVGRCAAYWPGSGRLPVGGASVPYKKLTPWSKEDKAEARERVLIIRTQVRVGVVPVPTYEVSGEQPTMEELLSIPVADMHDNFKLLVARKGVSNGYTSCNTAYLEVIDV